MLLAVLVFVLMTTMAASTMVQIHQTQAQRDREEQLLFVGDQYRRAIASYYNSFPPNAPRGLPKSLEDLVDDHRFPEPMHHLRRLYLDPMTGKADWELVAAGGGIVGVKSRSNRAAVKKTGFDKNYAFFEGRAQVSEWVFAIRP